MADNSIFRLAKLSTHPAGPHIILSMTAMT